MLHRNLRRRSLALLAVSLCALGFASAPAASAEIRPVPDAYGYDYSPGEPTIWAAVGGTAGAYFDRACTGGYAIAGDSGFFLTTADICSPWPISLPVRGDAGYYADGFYRRSDDPVVLLQMRDGNDAHQILADPTTGSYPGNGQIVGWTPSDQQPVGLLIGKMGIDTGWTEGQILGTADGMHGEQLLCTDASASYGDVGGPVWRMDENGLRALGTVAGITADGGACYRPIQETLYRYGASLPSYGPDQGRPGPGTFAPGMVAYDGAVNVRSGGRSIDKGDEWRLG
ncbi:hypothetical protein [Microbacterium azadirachtae]|uniref:Trypsin n=1 Tax=Microbacterium azadirachtae TaxID=582680 RepID=A0A0F0K8K2_9MICO|nr:hypothetical protein [Microbacterium azadirachtae]KJL17327.1 hypothetical protein RL72_03570 [Microbacterium azadirachtae]UXW87371.1 hypothetical protein NFX31_07635 [Microbacterium azadirachtae]SDL19858.1 hypothetical protein SAMN04488593_0280 [Microbacterium azadirachtae]SEF50267.1 hypothetical protein SAMN04488594_0270 [Microbacterium azadirachtae]SEF50335.1 hypothetical protein SAMN04488592_0279 [Microbacterium azadirachtae]